MANNDDLLVFSDAETGAEANKTTNATTRRSTRALPKPSAVRRTNTTTTTTVTTTMSTPIMSTIPVVAPTQRRAAEAANLEDELGTLGAQDDNDVEDSVTSVATVRPKTTAARPAPTTSRDAVRRNAKTNTDVAVKNVLEKCGQGMDQIEDLIDLIKERKVNLSTLPSGIQVMKSFEGIVRGALHAETHAHYDVDGGLIIGCKPYEEAAFRSRVMTDIELMREHVVNLASQIGQARDRGKEAEARQRASPPPLRRASSPSQLPLIENLVEEFLRRNADVKPVSPSASQTSRSSDEDIVVTRKTEKRTKKSGSKASSASQGHSTLSLDAAKRIESCITKNTEVVVQLMEKLKADSAEKPQRKSTKAAGDMRTKRASAPGRIRTAKKQDPHDSDGDDEADETKKPERGRRRSSPYPRKHARRSSSSSSSDGSFATALTSVSRQTKSVARSHRPERSRKESRSASRSTSRQRKEPSRLHMEWLARSLQKFSGNESSDVKSWVSTFARETDRVDEDTRSRLLFSLLTGDAREWYDTKNAKDARRRSTTTWLERLVERFDIPRHIRERSEATYTQQHDQSAHDYVQKKMRLILSANPDIDEESIVHKLTHGVHPAYAKRLDTMILASSKDLKNKPLLFQKMLEKVMADYHQPGQKFEETAFVVTSEPVAQPVPASPNMPRTTKPFVPSTNLAQTMTTTTAPTPRSASFFHSGAGRMVAMDECLNCLERGHYVRDCPRPMRPDLQRRPSSRQPQRARSTSMDELQRTMDQIKRQMEIQSGRQAAVAAAAQIAGPRPEATVASPANGGRAEVIPRSGN